MNVIVGFKNVKYSIEEAIRISLVKIEGNSIIPQMGAQILPSTNLFDIDGDEIFVGDILIDSYSNKKFIVIQYYSSAYVQEIGCEKYLSIEKLTDYKFKDKVNFCKEK